MDGHIDSTVGRRSRPTIVRRRNVENESHKIASDSFSAFHVRTMRRFAPPVESVHFSVSVSL